MRRVISLPETQTFIQLNDKLQQEEESNNGSEQDSVSLSLADVQMYLEEDEYQNAWELMGHMFEQLRILEESVSNDDSKKEIVSKVR